MKTAIQLLLPLLLSFSFLISCSNKEDSANDEKGMADDRLTVKDNSEDTKLIPQRNSEQGKQKAQQATAKLQPNSVNVAKKNKLLITKSNSIKEDSLAAQYISEASKLLRLRNFEQAKQEALKARNLLQKNIVNTTKENKLLLARSYLIEGDCLYDAGKWFDSESPWKKAREIYLEVFEENDPKVVLLGIRFSKLAIKRFDGLKAKEIIGENIRQLKSHGDEYIVDICNHYIEYGNIHFQVIYNLDTALTYYEKVLEHDSILREKQPLVLGKGYSNAGVIYMQYSKFEKAIDYFTKGVESYLLRGAKAQNDLLLSYSYLGQINYSLGNYNKAKTYFEKSKEIILNQENLSPIFLLGYYNSYSGILAVIGDYDKAIAYLKNAGRVGKKYWRENPQLEAQYYNNLGTYHYLNNEVDQAIKWHKEAQKKFESSFPAGNIMLAKVYLNLAGDFMIENNIDQARYYVNKSLEITDQFKLELDRMDATTTKGIIEYNSGNYIAAINCLQEVTPTFENKLGPKHNKTVGAKLFLLKSLYRQLNWNAAQDTKSVILNDIGHSSKLNSKSFSYTRMLPFTFATIGDYHFTKYNINQVENVHDLDSAQFYYDLAIHAIGKYRLLISSKAKLTFVSDINSIFGTGIKLNLRLYDRDNDPEYKVKAFQYAEQSKALVLYEAIQNANKVAGLPDSLHQIEKEFRIKITDLQNQLELGIIKHGTEEYEQAQNKVFELTQDYEEFLESLKENEQFYNAKVDLNPTSLEIIQMNVLSNNKRQ